MGTQRRLRREPLPGTGRPVRGWPVAILDRNRSRIQRLYTEYLATAVPERAHAARRQLRRQSRRRPEGTRDALERQQADGPAYPRLPGVPAYWRSTRSNARTLGRPELWRGVSEEAGRLCSHAPLPSGRRAAQAVVAQLQKIGLDVEVKRIRLASSSNASATRTSRGTWSLWAGPRLPRSAAYLNTLFEGGSWPTFRTSTRGGSTAACRGQPDSRGRTDIARTDDSTSTSPATPRRWSRSTT